MFRYSINLSWSDDDACYVATVSEFPGLAAFGETPEEAAEEAQAAVAGFVKVYEEDGDPIPDPVVLKPFSGQTRLRLPKSLHASLSQEAKKEGVSLNSYLVYLLSERNIGKRIERLLGKLEYSVVQNLVPLDMPAPIAGTVKNTFIFPEPETTNLEQYSERLGVA